MKKPEHCPNEDCGNQGWYGEMTHQGWDEDGDDMWEPIQVQCEWCYTNPNSVFNQEKNDGRVDNSDITSIPDCNGAP